MSSSDYPAAHSMDAHWFAIDEQGNIALFNTGEPGVIPEHAPSGTDEVFALLEKLKQAGTPVHYYIDDLLTGKADCKGFGDAPGDFFLLSSTRPLDEYEQEFGKAALRMHSPHGTIVYFSSGLPANLDLGPTVLKAWENFDLNRLGIYVYDCDEYQFGEPYSRSSVPTVSLNIAGLPASLQEYLRNSQFKGIDFPSSQRVWPRHFFPCIGYNQY